MKRACRVPFLAGFVTCLVAGTVGAADKTTFDVDGLKSTVPSSWKRQKPRNRLRYAEFRLPRAEGDKADADVSIFNSISGTPAQNTVIWKSRFVPPKGKKLDDVAKLSKLKIAGREAVYFEVEGTYLDRTRTGTVRRPGYRMIAVQFDGPKNVWHFKMIGPSKSVAKHKKEFDNWLQSFK